MPEAARARILKIGVGHWVRLREHSGVKLNGPITGIGPRAFQMEPNDAGTPVFVYYADIERLKMSQPTDNPFPGPWWATAFSLALVTVFFICGDGGCH